MGVIRSDAKRTAVLARIRAAEQGPALPIDPDGLRAAKWPGWRLHDEAARLQRGPMRIKRALLLCDDIRARQRKQPRQVDSALQVEPVIEQLGEKMCVPQRLI